MQEGKRDSESFRLGDKWQTSYFHKPTNGTIRRQVRLREQTRGRVSSSLSYAAVEITMVRVICCEGCPG
jgi:hypothetical protein